MEIGDGETMGSRVPISRLLGQSPSSLFSSEEGPPGSPTSRRKARPAAEILHSVFGEEDVEQEDSAAMAVSAATGFERRRCPR